MSAPTSPLKLLFLHGYTQSGPLFHAKTKALEKFLLKSLPAGTTLSFPTAPHLLKLSDLPGHGGGGGKEENDEESSDNWAWWRKNELTGEFIGMDETWRFLSKLLDDEGPFDGCIGFSQGGALAALLTSLLEQSPAPRPRPASFTSTHPALRFSAVYSGYRTPYDHFYEPKLSTPTLHFLGTLDTVVAEPRSIALANEYVGAGAPRVVFHPGGHYLPAGKQFAGVLVNFVKECVAAEKRVVVEQSVEEMDVPF